MDQLRHTTVLSVGASSREHKLGGLDTGYGHALVYPRQEVFFSFDGTPAFRDGCSHGTEGEEKSAARLFLCTNQWQLIRWLLSYQAL